MMKNDEQLTDLIVKEVVKQMNEQSAKLGLKKAKDLIERVEQYVQKKGVSAVIAVCDVSGNPIAVHVMDGAYLVSFDVAMKKAYSAVAVKMSTLELGKLAQVGGGFQGLDKLEADKMVFFGGGIPLMKNGCLVGALGISGGSGEVDHEIAVYGARSFEEM